MVAPGVGVDVGVGGSVVSVGGSVVGVTVEGTTVRDEVGVTTTVNVGIERPDGGMTSVVRVELGVGLTRTGTLTVAGDATTTREPTETVSSRASSRRSTVVGKTTRATTCDG